MFLTTLILAPFVLGAFSSPINTRIVNGTDAKLGEIPYIVSLRYYGSHTCGASILNSRFIITAAHCVYSRFASSFSIQYGLVDIVSGNSAPNTINVDEIFIHPDFAPGGGYPFDVAVVKLASSIPYSDNVVPAQLPTAFNATPENSAALLSGWGYPYSGGSVMTTLQKVNINVYSDDDCERIHANTGPTNRFNHVCAGVPEGGKGQCSGDSGGPLIVDNKLVGLVSWSVKPCTVKGYPGVFTKVSNVVPWVQEQMKN